MCSTRIWIKFNASTHDMMGKGDTFRSQQFSVLSQLQELPARKKFSFIISKYAWPQTRLNFYVFWLAVTSDTQEDGEIYKNMVHPINIRMTKTSISWEKISTKYYHIQTTPTYLKGRKISPLMPSNEAMFTSNWTQWRFFLGPYWPSPFYYADIRMPHSLITSLWYYDLFDIEAFGTF